MNYRSPYLLDGMYVCNVLYVKTEVLGICMLVSANRPKRPGRTPSSFVLLGRGTMVVYKINIFPLFFLVLGGGESLGDCFEQIHHTRQSKTKPLLIYSSIPNSGIQEKALK